MVGFVKGKTGISERKSRTFLLYFFNGKIAKE
jgi:hypothetical protein